AGSAPNAVIARAESGERARANAVWPRSRRQRINGRPMAPVAPAISTRIAISSSRQELPVNIAAWLRDPQLLAPLRRRIQRAGAKKYRVQYRRLRRFNRVGVVDVVALAGNVPSPVGI